MRYAIIICENKMTMMIMVMTNGMKYVEARGCVVAEADRQLPSLSIHKPGPDAARAGHPTPARRLFVDYGQTMHTTCELGFDDVRCDRQLCVSLGMERISRSAAAAADDRSSFYRRRRSNGARLL